MFANLIDYTVKYCIIDTVGYISDRKSARAQFLRLFFNMKDRKESHFTLLVEILQDQERI